MIALIEALNYRCLHYVRQEVDSFQILVGPNASGKSTFLDVVAFLGDFLRNGLEKSIQDRAPDIQTLMWMRRGNRFEIGVELNIPKNLREKLPKNGYEKTRYELAIGTNPLGELAILGETLWLKPKDTIKKLAQARLFPSLLSPPDSIIIQEGKHALKGWKKIVQKKAAYGKDYFFSETTKWQNPLGLGPNKSVLANLPEDEERFPVGTWVRRILIEGVQRLTLNSITMRRPAPPGSPIEFQSDGSNLPWVVNKLSEKNPESFDRWISHLRTALPDLKTVEIIDRPEDRHRYIQIIYNTGLKAPSWTVSDGTLRLLALTILAYIEEPDHIYLIEEPENGIHPLAVETVFQSLSSSYSAQILCASHSPVVLSLAEPEQVLCFAKTEEGATDVVRGNEHPILKNWKKETDLGTMFASGVLA